MFKPRYFLAIILIFVEVFGVFANVQAQPKPSTSKANSAFREDIDKLTSAISNLDFSDFTTDMDEEPEITLDTSSLDNILKAAPASGTGWSFDGTTLTIYGNITRNMIISDWHTFNWLDYSAKFNPEKVVIKPSARVATNDLSSMFEGFSNVSTFEGLEYLDTSRVTDMSRMFRMWINRTKPSTTLKSLDVSSFDTSNVTRMDYMFSGLAGLTNLNISSFDTSNVTQMECMFEHLEQIPSLDITVLETSQVTNMSGMFSFCKSITSLDFSYFDTGNVFSLSGFFEGCSNLTDPNFVYFDTSNVTSMAYMFKNCPKITNTTIESINNYFDTSRLSTVLEMFHGCIGLTSVKLEIDTSNLRDMSGWFWRCKNVTVFDVSSFNTSKVTDMGLVFSECLKIKSLDISNFDTSNVTTMRSMFSGSKMLEDVDLSHFDTSKVTDFSSMFASCNSWTNLDVTNFDTRSATDMSYMFARCGFENIDVSNFVTNNLRDMVGMFHDCPKLTKLDITNFNTSKVTSMDSVFNRCNSLEDLDITKMNTSNVTSMSCLFADCEKLPFSTLNAVNTTFDTAKVRDMSGMFSGCRLLGPEFKLTIDTSSLTNASSMFSRCTTLQKLDISTMNTSKVTNMRNMFNGCSVLPKIDLSNFDTSKVTSMEGMFSQCKLLTKIDLSNFDTSKVTSMEIMFSQCELLTKIDLSNFNTSNVTTMEHMFDTCTNLRDVNLSSFDTKKLNYRGLAYMFINCKKIASLDLSNFEANLGRDSLSMFSGDNSLVKLTLGPKFVVSTGTFSSMSPKSYPHDLGYVYNSKWVEYFPDKDPDVMHPSGKVLENFADIALEHRAINDRARTYVAQTQKVEFVSDKKLGKINSKPDEDGNIIVELGDNQVYTTFNLKDAGPFDRFKITQKDINSPNVEFVDGAATIYVSPYTNKQLPFIYGKQYTAADFGLKDVMLPKDSVITITQPIKISDSLDKLVTISSDVFNTVNPDEDVNEWVSLVESPAINYHLKSEAVNLTVPEKITFNNVFDNGSLVDPDEVSGDLIIYNPKSFAQNMTLSVKLDDASDVFLKNILAYNTSQYRSELVPLDGGIILGPKASVQGKQELTFPMKRTRQDKRGIVLDFSNYRIPAGYKGETNAKITWSVTNSLD